MELRSKINALADFTAIAGAPGLQITALRDGALVLARLRCCKHAESTDSGLHRRDQADEQEPSRDASSARGFAIDGPRKTEGAGKAGWPHAPGPHAQKELCASA
jgi:hypothetical protein